MSLGNSSWSIKAGGGQIRASSQQLARAVVHLDVSPLGTPNTLIPIGDPSAIPTLLDSGRLAEVCAVTAQEAQSRDDHGLACTGFACDHRESRGQFELSGVDDAQRGESQVLPHQLSPR